jgi:hypothetical protein
VVRRASLPVPRELSYVVSRGVIRRQDPDLSRLCEEFFLWRDLRPLLDPVNDSPIIYWLRDAFDAIGYVQPLGLIGDLNNVGSETRTRNRKNSRLSHILNTP